MMRSRIITESDLDDSDLNFATHSPLADQQRIARAQVVEVRCGLREDAIGSMLMLPNRIRGSCPSSHQPRPSCGGVHVRPADSGNLPSWSAPGPSRLDPRRGETHVALRPAGEADAPGRGQPHHGRRRGLHQRGAAGLRAGPRQHDGAEPFHRGDSREPMLRVMRETTQRGSIPIRARDGGEIARCFDGMEAAGARAVSCSRWWPDAVEVGETRRSISSEDRPPQPFPVQLRDAAAHVNQREDGTRSANSPAPNARSSPGSGSGTSGRVTHRCSSGIAPPGSYQHLTCGSHRAPRVFASSFSE